MNGVTPVNTFGVQIEGDNEGRLLSTVKKELLDSVNDAVAKLVVGSTAFKSDSELENWDDIDTQVYTRGKPQQNSHYGILNDSGKHILFSAYFMRFDPDNAPRKCVTEQKDVRVLYGAKEALKHIYVERPRRIEPLPKEIPKFDRYHEVFFNILVDIFFILNRSEAKGKANLTKARVARDGLRTIAKHFYRFYGVEKEIPSRIRWRKLLSDVNSLLADRDYAKLCRNQAFAETAIRLMESYMAEVRSKWLAFRLKLPVGEIDAVTLNSE